MRKGSRHSEETKKKIGDANRKRVGSKNPRWTETPSVFTMHKRVWKQRPKTNVCQHCGQKGKTEFANIKGHQYTDNPDDYIELCRQCHVRYDK